MAVCWRFTIVLLLTLIALISPSQPLFQPPSARMITTREDLGNSGASVERRVPLHLGDLIPEVSGRRHQRPKSRKLVQQQRDSQGKSRKVNFESVQEGRSKAGLSSSPAREILAKYRFPRKSSHFESDRMVPTGPNPLHNSNRSQVIFP